jgi:hypothetical protein
MPMQKKGIIIATLMALALVAIGISLLINSLIWKEKREILLNDSFIVPANSYEYRTASIRTSGEYVASFNVSNGIIKFFPFTEGTFTLWQEGQFNPHWTETYHTNYGMMVSLETEGKTHFFYFVFLNEDSFNKEVSLQVSRIWEESNYVNLLSGAAFVLAGMVIGVVIIYKLQK